MRGSGQKVSLSPVPCKVFSGHDLWNDFRDETQNPSPLAGRGIKDFPGKVVRVFLLLAVLASVVVQTEAGDTRRNG